MLKSIDENGVVFRSSWAYSVVANVGSHEEKRMGKLVAGLMAWGGAKMEEALHRYIDRLGWATVALVVIGGVWYGMR